MSLSTLLSWLKGNLTNPIKYKDITLTLSEQTWNTTAGGMYCTENVSVADNVTAVLGATLIGFGNIRSTDVIAPLISSDGKAVRLMSNVTSFASSNAYLKVRVTYLE